MVTIVTLCPGVKAQAVLKAKGRGKGGEAWEVCKVLGLWAGNGDDDCKRFFTSTAFIRSEPSGLFFKCKSSVEGSEFFANHGKSVGGGNVVHKKLCRG